MGSQNIRSMNSSDTITPPATPAGPECSRYCLASSKSPNSPRSEMTEDLISLRPASHSAIDKASESRRTEPVSFPYKVTDYEFQMDKKGKKTKLGEGLWSDVYLARPCLSKLAEHSYSMKAATAGLTPPMTPTDSQDFGSQTSELPVVPPLYAIKVPASTSAKKVLIAEAKILSHLSQLPGAQHHIVPFFGLDTRTGALVLEAMQSTLESWIQSDLNSLDEVKRAQRLAMVFPGIAMKLIDSLVWMHKNQCIHADVKPSNILVSGSPSATPFTLFSDFSSTVLTTPNEDIETSPVGAGTWDYLDPSLLSSISPASPSQATDLWSLAITLLYLVIGASPYEMFKLNKFQQREMIKSGSPLQCFSYGDEGIKNMKRLDGLSKDLGWNVQKWFAKVLVKKMEKRAEILDWKEELGRALS